MARGERINNPITIRLELTQAEAEALEVVLNHVVGTPETTRRGLMDNISDALIGAGIEDTSGEDDGVTGSGVFFHERFV